MVQETPLITLHEDWAAATDRVKQTLASAGFDVIQSFDLRVARIESGSFICPIHSIDQCDGQMIELLVYDRENPPITLEVHIHDGLVRFALVDAPERQSNPLLREVILQALREMSISKQYPGVGNHGG